ncbi:FUSC family protein [Diplocloster modestus]
MLEKMKESFQKNFVHATLNFVFIIIFINVFQAVFGAENTIVGVIFTIMMSASMVRDMTATPMKHLVVQAGVLVWMGVASYLVNTLNPYAALLVNLVTVFCILYAFTYEYSSHMYFPYILSYLFLVFISPVGFTQLPKRLLGLLAGAVSIIVYQLFNGRKRVVETAQDVLTSMIGEAEAGIRYLLNGEGEMADPADVRNTLCRLSRTVYERRRKVLCVSDASFSMIDAGRGMEHIILLLHELEGNMTIKRKELLKRVAGQLEEYRRFLNRQTDRIGEPDRLQMIQDAEDVVQEEFYHSLVYICDHLIHMTDPQKRTKYHRTALSLSLRLKAALDVSPVRVIYALRVSVLLALFTLLVQVFHLEHGKWLLFTLASLSLPYADDVGVKTRKRIVATIAGGMVSVAVFGLISNPAGRTAVMMLSGYLSFYFSDYTGTYACSTIGALGGAVFMGAFGVGDVGQMFMIRLTYIGIGALIALAANCLIFPYRRSMATKQLLEKYAATTGMLAKVCFEEDVDPQLYYELVIQSHLQEEKLSQNASLGGWDEIYELLQRGRAAVRRAHRHRALDW